MPHHSVSIRSAFTRVLPGFLLVFLSLLMVIWLAPDIPYPQQDSAWGLAINQAVADRLAFGREVLFTLGPWGAVYTGQYHPATDGMMLAGGTLVAGALIGGLSALAGGGRRWFVLLAPLLVATVGQRDPVFLALPLLLVVVAVALAGNGRTRGTAAMLLLTAACALLSFVKGTFGTQAVPMVALAVLALLTGRLFRLAGLVLALYAAALAGFWLLAGQRLADLPTYFRTIPVVIDGYAEGMALGGPWTDIAAYGGGSAVLLWLAWRDRTRSRLPGTVLLLLGLLLTLFVAFKSGFVRHDEHALIAAGTLAMMPVVLVQALHARSLAVAALVTLSALAFISHHHEGYEWPSVARGRGRLALAVSGAWSRVTDPGRLRRLFDAEMAAVRVASALPRVAGPTDIYSSGQMILLANGLQWSPRPALQSVTVFNGTVAKADLAFLEDGSGARGPVQNVFYRVESEDNRLRSTQDGLSWPALLTEFRVMGYDRALDMALLQRQPGVHAAKPDSPALLSEQARLGEEAPLPMSPTGLAWATLDIHPTLVGRLASFLFRLPVLSIAVRYADGTVEHARLASGPAGAGFLLSPRISDTSDMLRLLLPERRAPAYRPVSITVTGEGGAQWLWRPWFGLGLQSIEIPLQGQVREMLAPAKLIPLPRPAQDAGAAELCTIELVDGRPPAAKPLDARGIAQVSGWSIISLARGEAPDRVLVRLTDAEGHVWETVAEPRARPDVGGYFVNPALTGSGFDARFDVSSLAGPYTVTIVAERGQSSWRCNPTQDLLVHAPDAAAPGE